MLRTRIQYIQVNNIYLIQLPTIELTEYKVTVTDPLSKELQLIDEDYNNLKIAAHRLRERISKLYENDDLTVQVNAI